LNRTISQGSGTGGDKTAAFFSQFGAAGGNSWFQQQVKAALDGLRAFRENTSYVKREYASIMNGFHNLAQQYNAASGAAAAASSKNDFMSMVKPGSRPNRYATGGYVTGPQMALIGEGGEPEYVIPASKMGAAMSNYAAGARGGAVLSGAQVNIKTGPVTQMAGTDYVTKQDLISATSSAVNQTLSLLKSDPSTRRAIGVTR
jgi:SLT domain-containing protein